MNYFFLLKSEISLFFQHYPAWGFSLALVLGVLNPPITICVSLVLILIKKCTQLAWGFLLGALISFCCTKDIPIENGDYCGSFHPIKQSIKPGFYDYQTFIFGKLYTKDQTYRIKLLKKQATSQIESICHVVVSVKQEKDQLKTTLISAKTIKEAGWLYRYRKTITEFLKKETASDSYPLSSQMLFALLTGRLESRLLNIQFSEYGLSHILALSGFHLSLLFYLTQVLFAKWLRLKHHDFVSLLIISLYTLYLGASCSIVRAYGMTFSAFIHQKIYKNSCSLHDLSLALILTTFLCSQDLKNPAFGLTFVATLALIIFDQLYKRFIITLSPPNHLWDKLIFAFNKLVLLQTFVFVITLPFVLFYFGKAPIAGLLYNLFFPYIISVFMIACVICLLLSLIYKPFASLALNYVYQGFEFALEILKKPIVCRFKAVEWPVGKELLLIYILLLLGVVFFSSKKKQVL